MDKPYFEWQVTAAGYTLLAGDQPIGSILPLDHDHMSAVDEVSDEGENLFRWTRTFTAQAPISDVQLKMEFLVPRPMRYGMIPAISYDGNFWGSGQDPKGFIIDGEARVFAYHRVAVSGGTYSESEDWSVALFAQEGFDGSCALVPADRQTLHQLLLPESETPQVYIGRDRYDPPYEGSLSLESGDNLSVTAYLLVKAVEKPRQAWRQPRGVLSHIGLPSSTVLRSYGVADVHNDAVPRQHQAYVDGIFRGFSFGLQWTDEQWTWRPVVKYEIRMSPDKTIGLSIQFAIPLILSSLICLSGIDLAIFTFQTIIISFLGNIQAHHSGLLCRLRTSLGGLVSHSTPKTIVQGFRLLLLYGFTAS